MIVPEGCAYRGDQVSLDLHNLRAGTRVTVRASPSDEAVLVLLGGSLTWDARPAVRSSVFAEPAAAVVLPPGVGVDVRAATDAELALVSTVEAGLVAAAGATPLFIQPTDVAIHDRGKSGWRRQVHDIVAEDVPAMRLLVGETFNPPGEWSSFPPHKHDGADGEAALEEVYYFRCDPLDGFGLQGLYDAGGRERAVFVRHGTVVGIPGGYHPVSAAPGSHLYYLWALAGRDRRFSLYEDPAHRWLHEA
jgi:5-deoxy-glucuronate isomerase